MENSGLPQGWEVRLSNSKKIPYYYNKNTSGSQWHPPEGTDPERLDTYLRPFLSGTNPTATGAVPSADLATANSRIGAGAPTAPTFHPPKEKIRAAHLLIKHQGSRRQSSWREENITRTREEAKIILEQHLARIKSGEIELRDIAATESDCSSAKKRGDLGFFGKGEMQKEFEQAAFSLQPGEISGIVETASGLHLIERIE